jgi:hypothetical protein
MSNIVQFPKENVRNNLPQTEEEMMQKIALNRMTLVNELVNAQFSQFAGKLLLNGFPMEDEEVFDRYLLACEFVRAQLFEQIDIDHPLQDVLDNCSFEAENLPSDEMEISISLDDDDEDYDC